MRTFEDALEKVVDGDQLEVLALAYEDDLEDSDFIKAMCDGVVQLWKEDPKNGTHFAKAIRAAIKSSFLIGLAVGREMEKPELVIL